MVTNKKCPSQGTTLLLVPNLDTPQTRLSTHFAGCIALLFKPDAGFRDAQKKSPAIHRRGHCRKLINISALHWAFQHHSPVWMQSPLVPLTTALEATPGRVAALDQSISPG
jgi:hypothetical protein